MCSGSDGKASEGAGGAGGKSDDDESDEDDDADVKSPEDEEMFEKMRGRTRGRRSVVFAEPVKLDESWTPTVVPKSDEEKARIREVRVPALAPAHAPA